MFDNVDITPITLVDRASQGGFEFTFDGRVYVWPEGQVEFTVPRVVAEWLMRRDLLKVWTKTGEFVSRIAAPNAPASFLAYVGEELVDSSPIEIDGGRAEGWDAPVKRQQHVINLGPETVRHAKREMREHQGMGTRSGFATG